MSKKKKNFEVNFVESCIRSVQCKVEFGYRLNICSRAEEYYGNPRSISQVAGPFAYIPTSSQHSGIQIHEPFLRLNLRCC
jgi:hypothetical protein